MPIEGAERAAPRLLVFSDSERRPRAALLAIFERLAARAERASVLLVLRDYQLGGRARLAFGRELSALAARSEQLFGVADRADIARLLDAHVLHLPERGIGEREARAVCGEHTLISRACHDPERAGRELCDIVVLSPIIAPRKGNPPLGLDGLRRARARLAQQRRPPALFALGGVGPTTAEACLQAGADGVALIEAALAEDPEPLLSSLGVLRER